MHWHTPLKCGQSWGKVGTQANSVTLLHLNIIKIFHECFFSKNNAQYA